MNSQICKLSTEDVVALAEAELARRENQTAVAIPSKDAPHPYTLGASYLIRTVTMIVSGRLVWVGALELVLDDAAWIADTGRFHKIVQAGDLSALVEVEPARGLVIVGRGAIVDVYPWLGALPRVPK